MVSHKLNVQEKYYNLLKQGGKTIELRLYDEKRQAIALKDTIEFCNLANPANVFIAEVVALHRASDFFALSCLINPVLAGFANAEEMCEVMQEFYPEERQKAIGVIGIEIKRL